MQERNSQKVLLTALLECCLARQRLEWLLERREGAGRGKRGGGSFEIEIETERQAHYSECSTWQEGWWLI